MIQAAATLQNRSCMLRRTFLVLLCRTWCVRRYRLSAGFISPHLVYAVLGTSMPQLACSLSSPHLLRAHVQQHRDLYAFDTVTLRYVLSCSLVQAFCHDNTVGLVHGRNACFKISPRERNFATLDPTVNENANALLAPRTKDGSLH